MKDIVMSDSTGKMYAPSDAIRILNIDQVIGYLRYGVELLDVYPTKDIKSGKSLLVFLFDRKASKEAYDKWCKYELEV